MLQLFFGLITPQKYLYIYIYKYKSLVWTFHTLIFNCSTVATVALLCLFLIWLTAPWIGECVYYPKGRTIPIVLNSLQMEYQTLEMP